MHGRQWRRHWRISALGALLCVLAAVFAVEAKVAWYSPNGRVRVELSSTKLQAADATRQIDQTLAAPAPVPHFPVELLLFLSFAAVVPILFIPRLAPVPPRPPGPLFLPPFLPASSAPVALANVCRQGRLRRGTLPGRHHPNGVVRTASQAIHRNAIWAR